MFTTIITSAISTIGFQVLYQLIYVEVIKKIGSLKARIEVSQIVYSNAFLGANVDHINNGRIELRNIAGEFSSLRYELGYPWFSIHYNIDRNNLETVVNSLIGMSNLLGEDSKNQKEFNDHYDRIKSILKMDL